MIKSDLGSSNRGRAHGNGGTPRVIPCDEQGLVDVPLEDVLGADRRLRLNTAVEKGDYFAVHLRRGTLRLQARAYVGFVPLNERIVVYVRPRVPINNLTRVVGISGQPTIVLPTMRGYLTGGEWTDSLLDLYTVALLRQLERLAQQGLWREYRRQEERSSFPHGRIMVHRTVQQLASRNIEHAAYVSWFERTADTPANRCMKYAVWLLSRRYQALAPTKDSRKLWTRLNAAYPMFDDALLDQARQFLNDPFVSGRRPLPTLRAYYRDALDLALAIIEERSVLLDKVGDAVSLPSLVVNMNDVFEAYVRNTVSRYAQSESWGVGVFDGKSAEGRRSLFDTPSEHDATPDIVLQTPAGTPKLVCEVKNVPRAGDPERIAINQAVTYALRYRTGQVLIITPCKKNQATELTCLGDIDMVKVFHYRLDLGAADLVAEEADLAEAVRTLV